MREISDMTDKLTTACALLAYRGYVLQVPIWFWQV